MSEDITPKKVIDDGGFVYPLPDLECDPAPRFKGITRRDWLAGLAMQGMLSNMGDEHGPEIAHQFTAIARLAYIQSDAIIKESKKTS